MGTHYGFTSVVCQVLQSHRKCSETAKITFQIFVNIRFFVFVVFHTVA